MGYRFSVPSNFQSLEWAVQEEEADRALGKKNSVWLERPGLD